MQYLKTVVLLAAACFAANAQSQIHYFPTNPGATLQAAKWTVANSTTNLQITQPTGTTSLVAKAAATTQSVTLFALPAKAQVLSCVIKSTTAFVGPTTLTATLGVTGTLTACVSAPFDLKAAVSTTNFSVSLPTPIVSYSGTNLILALTTTIDNVSTISTGTVDITITWQVLP